jgi:hypothetical protein
VAVEDPDTVAASAPEDQQNTRVAILAAIIAATRPNQLSNTRNTAVGRSEVRATVRPDGLPFLKFYI